MNKTILITGASSGIRYGVAKVFRKKAYRVISGIEVGRRVAAEGFAEADMQ